MSIAKTMRMKFDLKTDKKIDNKRSKEFYANPLTGKALVKWKYQQYMKDFMRCTKAVDENVGRVLAYLKESGLDKNTIVMYSSDQGFYMGEHGWFDKRFMYEESFRTPLLISFPKAFQRGEVNELVQNIDYAPTMLDFAGIDIPEDMQGISLKKLLEQKETDIREALYYQYYEFPNEHGTKKHYGIRTDRYKLIHFYEDIDSW